WRWNDRQMPDEGRGKRRRRSDSLNRGKRKGDRGGLPPSRNRGRGKNGPGRRLFRSSLLLAQLIDQLLELIDSGRLLLLLRRPIGGLASPLGTVGWSCADKNSALLAPGELHRYRDSRRHSLVEDSAAAKLVG